MAGYWRTRLTYLAEVVGIEGPPTGALLRYAEDLLGGVLDAARRDCGEGDYERIRAIGEIEMIAQAILDYDVEERSRRLTRALRSTKRRDRQVVAPAEPVRHAATVRDRYQRGAR